MGARLRGDAWDRGRKTWSVSSLLDRWLEGNGVFWGRKCRPCYKGEISLESITDLTACFLKWDPLPATCVSYLIYW